MSALSKFLCAVVTVVLPVAAVCAVAPAELPAGIATPMRGHCHYQGVASMDASSRHASRLNQALWEGSFEGGTRTSPLCVVNVATAAGSAPLNVGYGGSIWAPFTSGGYAAKVSARISRKPDIGACLLAALAITVLAVSRRGVGRHPIVPPKRLLETRASVNGAQ